LVTIEPRILKANNFSINTFMIRSGDNYPDTGGGRAIQHVRELLARIPHAGGRQHVLGQALLQARQLEFARGVGEQDILARQPLEVGLGR
jgi:hypothetical protein